MYVVCAFYKFLQTESAKLAELQQRILELGTGCHLGGLFLIAGEGINATVAGSAEGIERFKGELGKIFDLKDVHFKQQECARIPFRRYTVDIRKEIITSWPNAPELPERTERAHTFLSPEEWHSHLTERTSEDEKIVVLDTRNTYETALGMFRGAIDPKISVFSDFPTFVQNSGIEKDRTVFMYCTGGIRCEKAALEMERQGYKSVYQLEGGILNYLEHFPNGAFEGECFVFDHRVAVDQELQPSRRYSLCPHCGDPATEQIDCIQCGKKTVVCKQCITERGRSTCSKNCQHHAERISRKQQQANC